MPPRLGHKKSRQGCLQCKARRVKCDELRKPKCGNCMRLNQDCSFLHPSASPALEGPVAASQHRPRIQSRVQTPARRLSENSSAPTEPRRASSSVSPGAATILPSVAGLAIDDLRLLHHFVTETAPRLSNNPEAQHVWATAVVRLGYTDEYLMRAILAVAALHSSVVYADDAAAFLTAAQNHLDIGLAQSRPHLAAIAESNCNSCFAFSCLISVYQWALPVVSLVAPTSAIDSTVQAIRLVRGSFFLAMESWSWVANGPLSAIVAMGIPLPIRPLPEHTEQHLRWLISQAKLAENSEAEQEACISATECLRQALVLTLNSGSAEINYLMMWPAEASPTFLSMLEERRASALIILAYYAPLIYPRGPCAWLFGASGQRLLDEVLDNIRDTVWEQPVKSAAESLRRECIASAPIEE